MQIGLERCGLKKNPVRVKVRVSVCIRDRVRVRVRDRIIRRPSCSKTILFEDHLVRRPSTGRKKSCI